MTDAGTTGPPGCLVILIQASEGMAKDTCRPGNRVEPKATAAKSDADHLLDALVKAAADPLPVALEVAVVAYRVIDGAPAFLGLLPDDAVRFVPLAELRGRAAESAEDGPRSWVAGPGAAGQADPAAGLAEAYRLVAGWLAGRYAAHPPVVVHCTDGRGLRSGYGSVARSLRMLATAGGRARLIHWVLADADAEALDVQALRRLRKCSTRLPSAGPEAVPAMAMNECPIDAVWGLLFGEPRPPQLPGTGSAGPARILRLPKQGNSDAEWEDAAADDPATGTAAVADGASEGIFSRLWADTLARRFVADRPDFRDPGGLNRWLGECRTDWRRAINYPQLRWSQQNKVTAVGAAATLVGLRVGPAGADGAAPWEAVAVGDACLFWVRGDRLVGTFPLADASHLNSTPALLRSNPGRPAGPVFAAGGSRPGDLFLLATDAVAGALFRAAAAGEPDWERFERFDAAAWREWVDTLRADGRMVNDDCTLVTVRAGRPLPPADPRPGTEADSVPADTTGTPEEELPELGSRDGDTAPGHVPPTL